MTARTQPLEANAFTKFKLLMWKNFLQQWRHRVQTTFELFLPVLTMCLILILRWQVEPTNQGTLTYPPIRADSLNYSTRVLFAMANTVNLTETEFSIAFSPNSTVLEDVVRSAYARLLVRNINLLPTIIEALVPELELPPGFDINDLNINTTLLYEIIKIALINRVQAYNSSADLRGLYAQEATIRKVIAGVEFDDELFGATELPSQIIYALRFPERPRLNTFYGSGGNSWRSDLVFPAFELVGPRYPNSWEGGRDPGYVNEMFIALQQVISSEIISRITNEDYTQFDVNIQRYPHPPYVQDWAVEILQHLLPLFLMLTFSYTSINIVRAVTVEKELQLKETMKIMGLPTWLHWTAWFCKQFLYLFISSILIVVLLKVNWFTNEEGFSDYAVFTNTPWIVLLVYINLYLICTICFCFMISGFFSSANTAALCAGLLWFASSIPALLLSIDNDVSGAMQAFTCLSINSAMTYGFQLLFARESTGGIRWSELFSSPSTESSRFALGHVFLMLVLDSVIYMLIALYLEQVLPGPYGTPKQWNFLFTKDFWMPRKNRYGDDMLGINNDSEDILKEKDPTGHTVGVKITNLTKVYGPNIAVNHLSLNIYDDQITVLLGHNGAGKSTTISMLTGNLEATHGSVIVAGYDITRQSRAARAHLGLCPQHNVLFNELTVREHLEFFARLKGFKGQELEDDINTLIEKLELQEKRDYPSAGLSGGQKRRLCVGIALSGAAKVVLLDEPTSGMDPSSRRALWDLLQKEKQGRSMILTTHFMDEADFLGDRIAIMAHGRLQCVGSPQFLKGNHGVGYQLVVVKDTGFDYEMCLELINKYIPGITIMDDRGTELKFSLLNDHAHLFETMLADLEKNDATIKFKNYGLIATTLEDVFMSLGADLTPVNSSSDDGNTTTVASEADSLDQLTSLNDLKQEVTGFRLILQHCMAMWLKLWLYWTRSWGMVLLQLIVPVVLINMTLLVSRFVQSFTHSIMPRNLTLFEGFAQTETLISFTGTSLNSLGGHARQAYESMFVSSGLPTMGITVVADQAIDDYYMDRGQESVTAMGSLRHSLLTGATFNDNSATAWFSNFGYHDVAVSLAAVHSALLKSRNATAFLHVYNHPLEATYSNQNDMQSMVALLSMQLANGIGSSVGIVTAVFVMFYVKERASGSKLLQRAAGLQPSLMWFSAALFDWLWFILICITIIISCAAFRVVGFSTALELARLYLLMMIYGAAMLPMNYLFSLIFKGPAVGFVVVFFVNVLFGMIGAQLVEALSSPTLDTLDAANAVDSVLQFFPMYSFITAVRLLNQAEMLVQTCLAGCDYIAVVAPNQECNLQTLCSLNSNCCIEENSHFTWEPPGILRYLMLMIFSCILLWGLLMVIEYRLLNRLFTRKRTPQPIDASLMDKDVADEENHVNRIDKSSLHKHGLVAKGLSKYYGKHLAVNQVSFSVSDSECFGLLGVNGAGKTTTFKMLMGDESFSSGEAFVSGHSVEKELTTVHKNIGYCPQFDALFNELTGRETLRLFSLLRGLRTEAIDLQATTLATSLGFLKHLDKRVGAYSGGTKRKLNTALAFLGKTRLVFVDEPTTGVDPAAKRHVWRAVRSVQKSGRGVVLTSHSMEECEALCSRLTIMVNGRFQCLGTPQHLKNKFSEGYTLTIKLKLHDHVRHSKIGKLTDAVKDFVYSNFINPKIMEEYQGVLTYYLPDLSMSWSKMFGIMERAKRDLAVEYYSISQTTLEQIFLQFTKYQIEESIQL